MLEEESGFPRAEEQFRVHHVMQRYGVSIPHAEATKLSKVTNSSGAIVWKGTSLFDTLKALFNHSDAFKLEYSVKIIDARTESIVDHFQSSNHIKTRIDEDI